jgi:hypothetical protein
VASARAAQDKRQCVSLLAGEQGCGIDQSGDVGIQARIVVVFGLSVVIVAFDWPAARGRG